MTTAKNGISHGRTRIQQFNAAKQIEFFESLKQSKFSGQLAIAESQDTSWTFIYT